MNDTYKVRQVGGTLMVTVPQHVARLLLIEAGQEVRITVSGTGKSDSRGVMWVEPLREKTATKGRRK